MIMGEASESSREASSSLAIVDDLLPLRLILARFCSTSLRLI